MLLFFISFIMVFGSAYFATAALKRKTDNIIYFLLIAFANLVLTFEVLSLFGAISQGNVLALGAVILAAAAFFWNKSGRPGVNGVNVASAQKFFNRFFNALKLDKYLAVLFAGYVVLIGVLVFLMSFMPVVNADANAYHIMRSAAWVHNGSLNHFVVADIRNLVMPINSEIIYAWIILFTKKLVWFGFVSFTGYILAMVSLFKLLGFVRLALRKKLWVIFIVSSFPAVIVGMSGTETDIIIAGLILACIVLFLRGAKSGDNVELFFAALAYALAIGTKTPAIMAIPAVGLAMLAICHRYKNYKALLKFIGFGVMNFVIFASYNYILNVIAYGSPAGSQAFLVVHQNRHGLAGIPANFIKYLFMFFDFTGFRWGQLIEPQFLALRENLLALLHLDFVTDGLYTTKPLNQSLLEPLMGLGILGFILYLPCWIWAGVKGIAALWFRRRRQTVILGVFALMLPVNILFMSCQLEFMMYSIRFLMAFCVISAPVIAYSYCKKNTLCSLYKFIVVVFAMFCLVLVSTSLWPRPFRRVVTHMKAGYNIHQLRETAMCCGFPRVPVEPAKLNDDEVFFDVPCRIRNFIRKHYTKNDRILIFANTSAEVLVWQMMNFDGYHLDFGLMENIDKIDLDKYSIIITTDNNQKSTNVLRWDERKNDTEFTLDAAGKISIKKLRNADRPCYYLNNNEAIIGNPNDPGSNPYAVECVLTKEFFSAHNMQRENRIRAELQNKDGTIRTINYFFYRNNNFKY